MKQPSPGESRVHQANASIMQTVLTDIKVPQICSELEPAYVEAMQLHGSEQTLTTLDGGVPMDDHYFPTPTYSSLLGSGLAMNRAQIRTEYGISGHERSLLSMAINLYSHDGRSRHLLASRGVFGSYDYELGERAEDAMPISFQPGTRGRSVESYPIDKAATESLLDEFLHQVGFDEADRLLMPEIGDKADSLLAKSRRRQNAMNASYKWEDPEHGSVKMRILRIIHSAGSISSHELILALRTERQLTESEALKTSLVVSSGNKKQAPFVNLIAGVKTNEVVENADFSERNKVFDELIKRCRTYMTLRKNLADIAMFLSIPSSDAHDICDEGYDNPE